MERHNGGGTIDVGQYPKLEARADRLKRSILLAIRREFNYLVPRYPFKGLPDSQDRLIKEVSKKMVYFKKHDKVMLNEMSIEDLLLILNTIERGY